MWTAETNRSTDDFDRRTPTGAAGLEPVQQHLLVPRERSGIELDEFLCLQFPLLNKGYLRRQVREGSVLVDGQPGRVSQRLKIDQVISIGFDLEDAPAAPAPPPKSLSILYEDEAVMVIDKPDGVAVEPERWARDAGCVSGALLELALERSGSDGNAPLEFRPRLVHRIDKDTTGCLLVAKTIEAERELREAFSDGRVQKSYLALVEGEHPLTDGAEERIEWQIAADRRRNGKMRATESGGKASTTVVSVQQRFKGYTLMRAAPLTGRTHQIRVHLAAEGFPLVVDPLYGRRTSIALSEFKRGYRPKRGREELPLMNRLTLHAHRLRFPDLAPGAPQSAVREVVSDLPKDFQRLLTQLSKVRPFRR